MKWSAKLFCGGCVESLAVVEEVVAAVEEVVAAVEEVAPDEVNHRSEDAGFT